MSQYPLRRVPGVEAYPALHTQSEPGKAGKGFVDDIFEQVAFNKLQVFWLKEQLAWFSRQPLAMLFQEFQKLFGQTVICRNELAVPNHMLSPVGQLHDDPIIFQHA